MEIFYLILAVCLLFLVSFANGANDVSKAIATLAGSGTASVRTAILWGTVWTVAGALSGIVWGGAIIRNISENIYTGNPDFIFAGSLASVMAPILWVFLATWRKWPVSTTHSVVGGLLGAGLMAFGTGGIDWNTVYSKIALPLLVSPFVAIGLAWFLTPYLDRLARVTDRLVMCLAPVPKMEMVSHEFRQQSGLADCLVCKCDSPQAGLVHGVSLSVDSLHWFTSGLLSFSRGLNDSPKLIAIVLPFLVMFEQIPVWIFVWGGLAMGLGSWMAGKNITRVLGFEVTKMNHEQGFSANLVAALLVIGASRFGMPVSTTHVSSCSIMGVGLVNKEGLNMHTVKTMLFAWLVTVPASATFAFIVFVLFY